MEKWPQKELGLKLPSASLAHLNDPENVMGAGVADNQPKDPGWCPPQQVQSTKVIILGDGGVSTLLCKSPDLQICSALQTRITNVDADGKVVSCCRHQSRAEILIKVKAGQQRRMAPSQRAGGAVARAEPRALAG